MKIYKQSAECYNINKKPAALHEYGRLKADVISNYIF